MLFFFYPFLLLADNHISFLSTGGFFALLLALASRLLHELKPKEVARGNATPCKASKPGWFSAF